MSRSGGRPDRDREVELRELSTPDGSFVAVSEAGEPSGPAVLLLHGLSFSSVAWIHQLQHPLLSGFRLIAPDLRGHGESGPPSAAGFGPELWSSDVELIISEMCLTEVVAVAWSYGAIALGSYLASVPHNAIAAVQLVAPGTHCGSAVGRGDLGESAADSGLGSDETGIAIPALSAFIHACAAPNELSPRDEALLLGASLRTAPSTRAAMLAMEIDQRPLWAELTLPLEVTYGDADAIITPAASARVAASNSLCRERRYAGSGHMPFWTDPDRFATDLAELVTTAR